MGYSLKRAKKSILVIFIVFTSIFMFVPVKKTKSIDYFFTIKGIYADYNEIADVASLYKNQLAKIGINLELEGLGIFEYIDQIYNYHDYDLFFGLVDERDYIDDINSSIGYDITLDYNSTLGTGKNQWYLDTYSTMFPPTTSERRQLFYEWQDYLMDEIVPITPLLASSSKSAYWYIIEGYNSSYGVIQSIGNIKKYNPFFMFRNTSELVLGDRYGSSINPIKYDGSYLEYPLQAIFDPLIWSDGYRDYWPHIAKNWVHINNTHVRFTIRDDIKWANDPDGLFTSEFLDTEDVYFSYYCYKYISPDGHHYNNLKHFEIINETTIDVYFDGDPGTPENENYDDYLRLMNEMWIVPEHYLNQTQLGDGITPDDSHTSWLNYSSNAFGTGSYQIDSYVDDNHRDLTLYEDSWRLNSDLLLDSTLNWEERFGYNWTIKKIRILNIDSIQSKIDNLISLTLDVIEDLPSAYFYSQIPTEMGIEIDDFVFTGGVDVIFNLRENREIIGNRNPCPNDENITQGLAVRKAIAYASDAERINQEIYDGFAIRTYYPIPLSMDLWCSPTITKYRYNLGEAAYYMGLLGYDVKDLNASSEIIGILNERKKNNLIKQSV